MSAVFNRLFDRFPILRAFATNPVVVRDLRAQMRGTKSYWYQGAYLLVVGAIAVAGYAFASNQGPWANPMSSSSYSDSIVDIQARMEQFYYFIFLTLAALICLIAPALTASSIVGERQRQSLDLLVTTPLTAAEMLIGKLLSSIAFLGLLLLLSLPASALCVLIGGATLSDIFRIYLMLAVDGLVLSGIGLYFSCACKTNLLALLWTYGAVGAFLLVVTAAYGIGTPHSLTEMGHPSVLSAIGALNPFVAVLPPAGQSLSVGPVTIPIFVVTLIVAALSLRLLLAATTYRLGAHGGSSAPSLRRQILVLTGLASFLVYQCCAQSNALFGTSTDTSYNNNNLLTGLPILFILAFLAASIFLPALFVPAAAEDAPPGMAASGMSGDPGWYNLRRAFQPEHAGALPYFHLLLAVALLGSILGVAVAGTLVLDSAIPLLGTAAFYVGGLSFLVWGVARFAATLTKGVSQARGITFGIFALLIAVPLMVFVCMSNTNPSINNDNPLQALWLLYPLTKSKPEEMLAWLPLGALNALVCGSIFVGAAGLRRRRATLGEPAGFAAAGRMEDRSI